MLRWSEIDRVLDQPPGTRFVGQVTQVVGLVVEARVPGVQVGDRVDLCVEAGDVAAQVVGFKGPTALLMPLGDLEGVGMGTRVVLDDRARGVVAVGDEMVGRVVDGLGRPLDGLPAPRVDQQRMLNPGPINPLLRRRVNEVLALGMRSVDGMLTMGRGQRMAILAGAGVGKSTLLGSMARHTDADLTIIALIGERGREVREFLEGSLGPKGRKRSVVVVATSDHSPPMRVRAASFAMAAAEHFRAGGLDVLFLMDSLTRYAMAAREIGLSVGEPPTTKGYTPSVFALLPRFLERVGALEGEGSITGLFTVLVEGDDIAGDPIADSVRAIVDGHIVLSRRLANLGQYPAVDVLESSSRVFDQVTTRAHRDAQREIRSLLAAYSEAEDLINLGAYAAGSNPLIDRAIANMDSIRGFMRQEPAEASSFEATVAYLRKLTSKEAA